MARATVIPRSTWILLAVAVAAAAVLWLTGRDDDDARLVPFAPAEVERLVVITAVGSVELDRSGGAWNLGGLVADRVDPEAVEGLLAAVCSAPRSVEPVVSDAMSGDYGFGGDRVLALLVATADGRQRLVAFGNRNEVTGAAYVTLDGSAEAWLAEDRILIRLLALPTSLREPTVWPGFARADAETLVVASADGDRRDLLVRDDLERWWRLSDAADPPGPALAYHRHAADRLRRDAAGTWHRAADRPLENLLAALEGSMVRSFHAPGRGGPQRGLVGLRCVSRDGRGYALALATTPDADRIDAWRDACVAGLEIDADAVTHALTYLAAPLRDAVLTHGLAFADSFRLEMPGRGSLTARRGPDGGWEPSLPDGATAGRDIALHLGDMAVLLDRLALTSVDGVVAVADDVFADDYRLTVRTWQRAPGMEPEQSVVFGVARDGEGVVAWRPSDGLVGATDRGVLVSGRALLSGR